MAVKEIYLELLQNRAHYLTEPMVAHFEQLFSSLNKSYGASVLKFEPRFKE